MRSRLVAAALAAVAALAAGPLAGQSGPREAASAFLDAWNARRFADAAGSLDLTAFDRFRKDFVARTSSADAGSLPTVADLQRRQPGMPREAAEYQLRMMEEQRRRYADPTPYEFARVPSAAQLRDMPAPEAAARWLESRDPRWQVTMQFRQAGCPVPADVDQVAVSKRRLIGVVPDGEGTAYALFREEWPDEAGIPEWAGGDLNVLQLKLLRGRWLVVPRADLLPEVGEVDVGECGRSNR